MATARGRSSRENRTTERKASSALTGKKAVRPPRGCEKMLPLAAAIHVAEQAAIEHGPAVANAKGDPAAHRKAWAVFKSALDSLGALLDERLDRAQRHPHFTFGDLDSFKQRVTDWTIALCGEVRNWRDWATFSRSPTHRQTFRLIRTAQTFEQRLAAVEAASPKRRSRRRVAKRRQKRHEPTEDQNKALELRRSGKTYREIATHFGVSHTTARNWVTLAEAYWRNAERKSRAAIGSRTQALPTDADGNVLLSEEDPGPRRRRLKVEKRW